MTVSTSSLSSAIATPPAAPLTATLSTAVSGSVKTDITKALTAAGLGAYASSQQANDLVGKISQDAVSALQSPGSQGAAASLSKIITSDIGSALNQYGMGAYAGSSQVADLIKGLGSDVLSAAKSAGYSEAAASAPTPSAPVTPAAATSSAAAPAASAPATSGASTAATSAAASTASSASASTFNADNTVKSILKALQPLTGTGVNVSSLIGKVADAFSASHVGGEVGTVMSSVAASLQQTQAAAAAAAKASAASPTAATASAPQEAANSSAAKTKGPAAPPASLTNAQSASATLASMLAQNENSLNSIVSGKPSQANLGMSLTKNPLGLAYAAV